MKRNWLLPIGIASVPAFLLTSPASGGTIEKVMPDRDTVIIKLNRREMEDLVEGEETTVRFPGRGETAEVEVEGISGSKAKIYIVYGIELFESAGEGAKVRFKGVSPRRAKRRGGSQKTKDTKESKSGSESFQSTQSSFTRKLNPEGPLDGEWSYPYFMVRFLRGGSSGNRMGAIHTYRARRWAGGVQVAKADGKDSIDLADDAGESVADTELTQYGLFVTYNTPPRVRIGLTYNKDEVDVKRKRKLENLDDQDFETSLEMERLGLMASYATSSRVLFGLRFLSNDVSTKFGDQKASESFSRLQAAIGYYAQDYEVALLYDPATNIKEDDFSFTRPASFSLNYYRNMGSGRQLVFLLTHARWFAVDSSYRNAQSLTTGMLFDAAFGRMGALVHYDHKHYNGKENASPSTISHYGLDLTADYAATKDTHVGFSVGYDTGKGEGEDDIGIKSQTISIALSLTRMQ